MALTSLQQRVVTALVIAPVFICAMWLGGWVFSLLITIVTVIGLNEYISLIAHYKPQQRLYLVMAVTGGTILLLTAASLVYLRKTPWLLPSSSPSWLPLMMLMATVWATDIGAYFTGRTLGGPKLAPLISPNKTWSGLFGGMAGAMAVMSGIAYVYTLSNPLFYGIFGLILAVVAQGGDLLESFLKRRAGVKDSGTLLPGHGGVLDRIDGLIFTAPLFVVFMWLIT